MDVLKEDIKIIEGKLKDTQVDATYVESTQKNMEKIYATNNICCSKIDTSIYLSHVYSRQRCLEMLSRTRENTFSDLETHLKNQLKAYQDITKEYEYRFKTT